VINYGCHQVCAFAWILLFFFAANEDDVRKRFPSIGAPKSRLRMVASVAVLLLSLYVCKRRVDDEKRVERLKKVRNSIPKVTFSHKTQPVEDPDETLTQNLLSTTSSTVSRPSTSATLKPSKSKPGLIRPPIIAPQFGPLLSNHEFHQVSNLIKHFLRQLIWPGNTN
jgi:hypothetical protein